MPRALGKTRVCSLEKLWLLKYAKKHHLKCYPRPVGKMLESKGEAPNVQIIPMRDPHNIVLCCGKRLGRKRTHRRRKTKPWDWRRAYRAHASYRRPRRRR